MSKVNESNSKTSVHQSRLKAQERTCHACGKSFISRRDNGAISQHLPLTTTCYECRKSKRVQQQKEQEERENQLWQQKKKQEHQVYLEHLPKWDVVSVDSIQPETDQVLYIIGNGFDLMHGVRSSYSAFRDSLGKNSPLRFALESFWDPNDIWADFENALAKFNAEAMSSSSMVDTWLDIYDVYNGDVGAAEFFMAAEAAANPICTVAEELPRRFRMWVESLDIGTDDRPLHSMFRNGKVLCFNYTEFVETMYGVPTENVCYIHGCRRKKKYHPKDELILGHLPGASESSFEYDDKMPKWVKQPYNRYLVESAQDEVFRIISYCDDCLTKHSLEIIAKHHQFFDSLDQIKDIIVIGHSLSPVDWDYFGTVCLGLHDMNTVHWYFGCHGLRDLQNLEQLITKLDIPRASVSIFRTDDISVTPLVIPASTRDQQKPKVHQGYSNDQRWIVRSTGAQLEIINHLENVVVYETALPSVISSAFFTPSGDYLFVIIRGFESGILLFRYIADCWQFVDELEGIPNQGIMNRRLRRVFLKEPEIAFVYNNRFRVYDLNDGRLIKNRQLCGAKNCMYDGVDISQRFMPNKR